MHKKYLIFFSMTLLIIVFGGVGWMIGTDVIFSQSTNQIQKLFFFDQGQQILAFDPNDFQLAFQLPFNTYVTYGDQASDGRLFVADDGLQIGQWGEEIFVLKGHELVRKIPVFPTSRTIRVMEDKLVLFNMAYTQSGFSGMQIMDLDTYELLLESKEIGNIVTPEGIQYYQGKAYIAVPAFQEHSRQSYLLEIDLKTLRMRKISDYIQAHPMERYNILIDDHYLYLVFSESREIRVYDMQENRLVNKLSIYDVVSIPEDSLQYWCWKPQIIGEDLVIFMTDNLPSMTYQKLFVFHKETLEFRKEVDLEPIHNLRFFTVPYVNGSHLWIKNNDDVGIYEYQTGELIHTIHLANYSD